MKTIGRIGDLGSWRWSLPPAAGRADAGGAATVVTGADSGGAPAGLPGRPGTAVATSQTGRAAAVMTP
jgi:hypothetical protein